MNRHKPRIVNILHSLELLSRNYLLAPQPYKLTRKLKGGGWKRLEVKNKPKPFGSSRRKKFTINGVKVQSAMQVMMLAMMLFLASCSVNPFVLTKADGTEVASLGVSVFTKSKTESGRITRPDGSVLEYSKTGKNETTGITTSVAAYAAGQVAQAYSDSKAATDQAKVAAEAAKAKDATAATVEQARIAADLEKAKMAAEAATTTVKP